MRPTPPKLNYIRDAVAFLRYGMDPSIECHEDFALIWVDTLDQLREAQCLHVSESICELDLASCLYVDWYGHVHPR